MFHVPRDNTKIIIENTTVQGLQPDAIYKVAVKGDAVALTYSRFKFPVIISMAVFADKLVKWKYLNPGRKLKARRKLISERKSMINRTH